MDLSSPNSPARILLFLIGCIGTRGMLAYLSYRVSGIYLQLIGCFTLLVSISWFYLYFTGSRTTGREVFGGKIWWMNLRIFHAIFYLLFSISAFQNNPKSYLFLLADVIFGLIAFIVNRVGEQKMF